MAFRRSPVRTRSGPPSFARRLRCASSGWQAIELIFARELVPSVGARSPPKRRMSTVAVHRQSAAKVDCHVYPALTLLWRLHMPPSRRFVYILTSESQPNRYYTGLTSDVRRRIEDHNRGACSHIVNGRPWRLVVALEFAEEREGRRLRAVPKVRIRHRFRGSALSITTDAPRLPAPGHSATINNVMAACVRAMYRAGAGAAPPESQRIVR